MKWAVLLPFFLGVGFSVGARDNMAMLQGIKKESCFIAHVIAHQKEILGFYQFGPTYLSPDDKLQIELATATVASESKRMAVLSSRFGKITGRPLETDDCP